MTTNPYAWSLAHFSLSSLSASDIYICNYTSKWIAWAVAGPRAFETHESLVTLISEHHVYPDSLFMATPLGRYPKQKCFHLFTGHHMLATMQANAHPADYFKGLST